jgi:hypothetical protein
VNERLRRWREEFRVLLGQGRQIKACTSQEVLRLANIHPKAFQVERVKLTVLHNGRESLLLNGGRTQLNSAQDTGVEDVDSGVDAVSDELDGFFDKAVDARWVARLVDNDTVLRGFVDLGDHNCTLLPMGLVESGQFFEWVLANNVGVKHKERAIVFSKNFFRKLERAGGA